MVLFSRFSVEVCNIDVCSVASKSENVCAFIEIAGESPYQDMCSLFPLFPWLVAPHFKSVCGTDQYTIWLSMWMNYSEQFL